MRTSIMEEAKTERGDHSEQVDRVEMNLNSKAKLGDRSVSRERSMRMNISRDEDDRHDALAAQMREGQKHARKHAALSLMPDLRSAH